MLATVHVSPFISLALAGVVLALVVWYWQRLSTSEVPDTRRRIRRTSLVVTVVAVAVLVRAVSFVDGAINQNDYVITWVMATVLLLLIVLTAFLDTVNNLRLHRRHRAHLRGEAHERMASALTEPRAGGLEESDPPSS